jgi:hypothetical protein
VPGAGGLQFLDMFESGGARGGNSKQAMGDMLGQALQKAGLSEDQTKQVPKSIDEAGKSQGSGSAGAQPGSQGFGDMLEHALKSAGLGDDEVKNVLQSLNGGKAKGESESSSSGGDSTNQFLQAQMAQLMNANVAQV